MHSSECLALGTCEAYIQRYICIIEIMIIRILSHYFRLSGNRSDRDNQKRAAIPFNRNCKRHINTSSK